MRLVLLSDTHQRHDKIVVPDGDVLVHAGDFSSRGAKNEVERFNAWLGTLPHRHKVVIAGNHDFLFERDPERARALLVHAHYLQDDLAEVAGLRIWGSPWQPWFFDWAFNLARGPALAARWALVPEGVDVLLTHGPPARILDLTAREEHVGCQDLAEAIPRIRPRLHVFGHIHESYGRSEREGTTYVNASNCDLGYRPVQPPIVVEL